MESGSSSQPAPLAKGTFANAPYVNRPPSPPYIHVPSITVEGTVNIQPSYEDVDTTQLTKEDLAIITQNKVQIAKDSAGTWKYESRRYAQPVLDFLYLGPSSVARDAAFLKKEGITMLIAARDSRMAEARLMSVDRTAQSLNLVTEYIDVAGHQELIRAFPAAVRKINDHLLDVYRSQAVPTDSQLQEGQIVIDNANFQRGKVLVFCETGNDRSAAIVAAYIMAVFGMNLITTLQFVGLQRFCVNFDEETKYWLRSYEDILSAKRMVSRGIKDAITTSSTPLKASVKRGIEETMEDGDEGMEESETGSAAQLDMDRYTDRPAFTPFAESDVPMSM